MDKKAKALPHGFIEIVNIFKNKPNKLWAVQERESYDNVIQKWLDANDILMYSTCIEGKSVVAEWFIRTFKGTKPIKMSADNSKSSIGYVIKIPTGMQRPLKVPWRSSKGPNIRDLQGTFTGLSVAQNENWWFNEKMKKVFFLDAIAFTHLLLFLLEKQIFKSFKLGRPQHTYGT